MRWLWFKRTNPSRPWAGLPDVAEPLVTSMFHASVSVQLGDGQNSLFWADRWLDGKSIEELAPCLFQAVRSRTIKRRTVAQGLPNNAWARDITGALTVQVILDYLLIWDATRSITLQHGVKDTFLWKWTSDHCFSTTSAYRAFFIGQHAIPGAKILHKARAPGKCKFFVWLALHDRCWTAERRKRHNLQDDDSCALCDQEAEAIDHLLVSCSFARETWFNVLLWLRWHFLTPSNFDDSRCLVDALT